MTVALAASTPSLAAAEGGQKGGGAGGIAQAIATIIEQGKSAQDKRAFDKLEKCLETASTPGARKTCRSDFRAAIRPDLKKTLDQLIAEHKKQKVGG